MTTRRPTFSSNKSRPLSAIFLGSISTPSHIPALPEPPPSPGAESNGSSSGLPSPPATNSTGSGSTGDDTTNFGSVRQRPVSYSQTPPSPPETGGKTTSTMSNRTYNTETIYRSTTNINEDNEGDDDNDNDNDDGEDNTARLDRRRASKSPSENSLALQRVKSLTQRNRMALDKLSSISRLSSPSPSPSPVGNRSSRSPMPPHSAASSSSSTTSSRSRLSGHSHSQSTSVLHPRLHHASELPHHHSSSLSQALNYRDEIEQVLSGSETERETENISHRLSLAESTSSSDDQSTTSPSTASTYALRMAGMNPPTSPRRPRRTSLPTSPGKALNMTRNRLDRSVERDASPGPSRTPRKRPSTGNASVLHMGPEYDDRDSAGDLTSAALAAVARSRSPTSVSASGSGSGKSKRAALPREFMGRDRRSLDGRSTGSTEPQTPHRQPNHENTDVYLARGSSSPNASASTFGPTSANPPRSPRGPRPGRSSTVRELTRRHQTRWLSEDLSGDVEGDEEGSGRWQTTRGGSAESPLGALVGGRSLVGEGLRAAGLKTRRADDVFSSGGGDGRGLDDKSQTSGSGASRVNEGVGPPSSALAKVTFDTRPNDERRAHRASYNGVASRPATSMVEFNNERDQDRHGLGSSIHARQPTAQPSPQPDRAFSSPFTNTRRHTTMTPLPPGSGSTLAPQHQYPTSEHGRLMLESLQMFESHLSRLPPMGTTTTQTIPDLFRSAQNIVHASDKLNGLLRAGTNGALEEQIDAEVGNNEGTGGGEEIAEVWRRVGGEMRESLRISDEIVRTMTGFLLGVGKVLKETAAAAATGDEVQHHSRNISTDEELGMRRSGASPDVGSGGRLSRNGRMSAGSRDSWEPSPRNQGDTSISRMLSSRVEPRPPSALNGYRDTSVNLDSSSDREPTSNPGLSRGGLAGTVRRLFTPREQRDHQVDPTIGHEPSPTPASRNHAALERARTLPPPVPSPLPSLPSESLLHRSGSNAIDPKNNRHKPSMASISTIRGSANPIIPSVATPTTAITTDDGGSFSLHRSGSMRTTNVTFSRPTTISMSALNGLRKRTFSNTSSNAEEVSTSIQQVASPISGPEAERDTRRRTVGARAAGRISLDGGTNSYRDNGGGQQGVRTLLPSNSTTRRDQRRRTVTEIFS